MYKTDPAMHPNNAAMMVFTSAAVVVVVVALLPFRAAAAEGILRSFRCVPRVLCSAARVLVKKRVQKCVDKNELEKKVATEKEVYSTRVCIRPLGPSLFEPPPGRRSNER